MQIGSSYLYHNNISPAPAAGKAPASRDALPQDGSTAAVVVAGAGERPAKGSDEAVASAGNSAERATEERLAEEQVAILRQLKARDREVRQHEAAHKAVGGSLAGAISYTFQRGPDGVPYAVGGEVPIDISPAADPAATVEKMEVVKAAAMAPAQPSSQDLQVVAAATQIQQQARVELAAVEKTADGDRPGVEEPAADESDEGSGSVSEPASARGAASIYQRIGEFSIGSHSEEAGFRATA